MSAPRVEDWGETSRGERGLLFTLEGDGIRARISNFGATIVSLEVADRKGDWTDVVLGFDTLAEYESPRNPYFGGIVGRVANRIEGACFELDGQTYTLEANEGRHHLHGGSRGFDRVIWEATADQQNALMTFRRRSPDGEGGYPGNLDGVVNYSLRYARSLQISYFLRSDALTPVNLTQHSYFNLAGTGTIQDHTLELRANRYVAVDHELIPTGELRSVENSAFDFREAHALDERVRSYDVCYELEGNRKRVMLPACRLVHPRSGRALEIDSTQPGLQLYTGQHLSGLQGKHGRLIPCFGGVCLETQHFPDSVHHENFPSTLMSPGQSHFHATQWRFSDG